MGILGGMKHTAVLIVLLTGLGFQVYSQDIDYDEMLQRVDTVKNPVYKPVLSIGYGSLNFIGDVQNKLRYPGIGNPAVRLNITTFIDNQNHFAANFFFMTGTLTGDQRSYTDLTQNLNFTSNIFSIGATARYEFGHLISGDMKLRPYLSIGIEQLNFNTKGDLFTESGMRYYYWPDGSIRSIPEDGTGAAYPLHRDYLYETDLRSYERDQYGLGNYNTRSFAVPFELGVSLKVSDRVFASLGSEYHYTFTDFIDNVASEGTHVPGNRRNDGYLFTHLTLHFDMFSDPETRTVELLYADVELGPIFFDDEDGDFVLDVADHCPGTPYGVVVDTLGCPLDADNDGVPDYLDREPDTPEGSWVDAEGVTLEEEMLLQRLHRDEALKREDLEAYLALIEDRFRQRNVQEIPEKFAELDSDEDGYISFEELLKVIDAYFDFNVDLSLEELRQVNEFFFSQ